MAIAGFDVRQKVGNQWMCGVRGVQIQWVNDQIASVLDGQRIGGDRATFGEDDLQRFCWILSGETAQANRAGPIWAYIPEDSQTVITSANKGFPFVMTRAETKVAKAVLDIAYEISKERENTEKEKGSIKKLFGLV